MEVPEQSERDYYNEDVQYSRGFSNELVRGKEFMKIAVLLASGVNDIRNMLKFLRKVYFDIKEFIRVNRFFYKFREIFRDMDY